MKWNSGCERAAIKIHLVDGLALAAEDRLPVVDPLVAAAREVSEAVGAGASISTNRTARFTTRSVLPRSMLLLIPSLVCHSQNPITFSSASEAHWVVRLIFRSCTKAAACLLY